MNYLEKIGVQAKKASIKLALMLQEEKNKTLKACAQHLIHDQDKILEANMEDVKRSRDNGVKVS